MTTQITVLLPDDMVAFLDRMVTNGEASSRAAVVGRALEREMRRRAAESDVETLRREGAADDLDAVVHWAADSPAVENDVEN